MYNLQGGAGCILCRVVEGVSSSLQGGAGCMMYILQGGAGCILFRDGTGCIIYRVVQVIGVIGVY